MQTSIEWFIEQLLIYGDKAFNKEITLGEYHIKKNELIEQAKEIHKQEIIQCCHDNFTACCSNELSTKSAESYYNCVFKKD
jgi:hypothetical protein